MAAEDVEKKSGDYTTSPNSSSRTSTTVALRDNDHDDDHMQQVATGQCHENDEPIAKASLARTNSIAETLSLPHEIAFVAIVCMAQFFTRRLPTLNDA
jgi:hypothetical protein